MATEQEHINMLEEYDQVTKIILSKDNNLVHIPVLKGMINRFSERYASLGIVTSAARKRLFTILDQTIPDTSSDEEETTP